MRDQPSVNAEAAEAAAVPDRELLSAFVFHRDARAFEAIVRRHGPMVYGVVRRILREPHACDDAFQATFLVLARSAGRIRKRQSLASWLHGVAHRIARRALTERYRRQEQAAPMQQIIATPDLHDVETTYEQQLLDSELEALPRRYREPLVLHYLEGLSNREVAERLGLTVTAVEGRLKRAKTELRLRMTRRGVELSAIIALLPAANPATLQALIAVATKAGIAASAGTLPTHLSTPQAASLAGKELALMTTTTKFAAVLAVSVAAVSLIGFRTGNASGGGAAVGTVSSPSIAALMAATSQAEPGAPGVGAPPTASGLPGAPSPEVQSVIAPGSLVNGDAGSDEETIWRIREALLTETTFEFVRKPMREVISELAAIHRIPISLDHAEIRSLGISEDEEITAVANDISLQAALRDMLRDVSGVRLSYAIQGSTLLITSETKAEMLAAAGPGIYASGRELRERNTGRIQAALTSQTTVEFPGNPLRDVTEYLSQIHNIPIQIDEHALADNGISADEEVRLVLSGVTLQSALDLLLDNVAGTPLDYIVQNEVLKITTREQADEFLETRVYSVRDLEPTFTGTAVANTIRKSVQPRSWMHIEIVTDSEVSGWMGGGVNPMGSMSGAMPGMAENSNGGLAGMVGGGGGDFEGDTGLGQMEIVPDSDGNGTIDSLPGCLIITQTQRIHRQIEDLLDQLRQHAASAQPTAVPAYPGSPGGPYTPSVQEIPLGPVVAPPSAGTYPVPGLPPGASSPPTGAPYAVPTAPAVAPPATAPEVPMSATPAPGSMVPGAAPATVTAPQAGNPAVPGTAPAPAAQPAAARP